MLNNALTTTGFAVSATLFLIGCKAFADLRMEQKKLANLRTRQSELEQERPPRLTQIPLQIPAAICLSILLTSVIILYVAHIIGLPVEQWTNDNEHLFRKANFTMAVALAVILTLLGPAWLLMRNSHIPIGITTAERTKAAKTHNKRQRPDTRRKSMTEWIVEGQRARSRCRGYDIEAQWGSGRDFMNTTSERPSATPGAKRPCDDDQGIIIRVRSDHQGVDKLTMLVIADHEPQDAVRQYTQEHTPESLLPKHKDWIDEWKWLASYRNRARWRRMGNQATAFIGHLTLTVKMTTMDDAMQRINSAADPNRPYAMSTDHDEDKEGKEGFEKNTQVFIVELREDLHLITAMITKTSDEKTNSIKEYIKDRDPVIIATACLARSYANTPEAGPSI